MGRIYRLENHPTKRDIQDFYHYEYYNIRNSKGAFPLPVVGKLKNLTNKLKLPIEKIEKIKMEKTNICAKIKFPYTLKGVDKNNPEKCKQEFLNMKNTLYKDHCEIYTDGSKINNRTGCAYVVNGIPYKIRLTKYSSVFSAELFAILKSLKFIKNNNNNAFVIYSDSLSAIESIKSNGNRHLTNIKISEILNKIHNKTIVFEWVPSHVNITGNEIADIAAKEATAERNLYRLPLNINEYKGIVKKKIYQLWNKE